MGSGIRQTEEGMCSYGKSIAMRPTSIYVHIPFCERHCAYCDFNVYTMKKWGDLPERTVDAICSEIRRAATTLQHDIVVPTIFFGGGTPTFLRADALAQIVQTVRDSFTVENEAEITAEANPATSDAAKFEQMRVDGFNRLSIGVQSFNDSLLRSLDRTHSSHEALAALRAARSVGFSNVSLDLMFRLPGQLMEDWLQSLETAVSLKPEHISLYGLTLEPGTRFERLYAGGRLQLPDEELEAAMYEGAIALLKQLGYHHYEVSNFARPGFESRHNRVYWDNGEYLGFGPGAVSYFAGRRWKVERVPLRYVEKAACGADMVVEDETLPSHQALAESLMVGIRQLDGLNLGRLSARYAINVENYYIDELKQLQQDGLITLNSGVVKLTHRGLLVADTVASAFIRLPSIGAV